MGLSCIPTPCTIESHLSTVESSISCGATERSNDSRSGVSWLPGPVHIFGPIQACSDIFRLDGTRFTFTSHLVIRQSSDFGGFVLLRGYVSLAAVVAFAQDCRVKVSPMNFTTDPTRCPVSATFRKYVTQYSVPTRSQPEVGSSNGKAEVVCCRERGQDWIKSLQGERTLRGGTDLTTCPRIRWECRTRTIDRVCATIAICLPWSFEVYRATSRPRIVRDTVLW